MKPWAGDIEAEAFMVRTRQRPGTRERQSHEARKERKSRLVFELCEDGDGATSNDVIRMNASGRAVFDYDAIAALRSSRPQWGFRVGRVALRHQPTYPLFTRRSQPASLAALAAAALAAAGRALPPVRRR